MVFDSLTLIKVMIGVGVVSALALLGIQIVRAKIVDWALRTRLYPVDITSDWSGRFPSIKFDQTWGASSRQLMAIPEGKKLVLWARALWVIQVSASVVALCLFLAMLFLASA